MELTREKRLFHLILAAITLVYAVGLWPELANTHLDRNDNVSHLTLIQGMVHAIEQGRDPLDFWSPETVFGYPEIRVYQPLAHSIVAALYFGLGKTVSLITVFSWVRYLSLILLPVSFYAAGRLIKLPRLAAISAAAIAPLISAEALYGLEWNSYLWRGYGLFPQAVATHFWLLTVGFGFDAIRRGKRLVLTGILLGLAALTEMVYGYMGALTLCLLALMPDAEVGRGVRILRTGAIGVVSAALSFFQLLPPLLDRAIMNRSTLEPSWKWDSWGAPTVLGFLLKGELLDFNRLPVLSLLALTGAVLILWPARKTRRVADPTQRFLIYGIVVWILVFFGRPFWGPLLLLLGVVPDMPLHRVVSAVQTFLILLAACGVAGLGRLTARRWGVVAAITVVAILLSPAVVERGRYISESNSGGERNSAEFERQQGDVMRVLASVRERGGRTYAGLVSGWGLLFAVGAVPTYLVLTANQIPTVSYLAHTLAIPGDTVSDFDEFRPDLYRLFNIRTLLAPAKYRQSVPKLLIPRLETGQFALFDAPGNGYFDVVDAPVAARTDKQNSYRIDKPWLRSEWPKHKTHLLLDFFGDAPPGLPRITADGPLPNITFPATEPGQVVKEEQSAEVYQAEMDVSRASFVLFKMTWHPNWKVLVDGKAVKTVMLSPGFLGAPVTPGRHRIWCRYEPGNWKLPIAFAGLFCVMLLGAAERFGYLPGARTEPTPVPGEPAPPVTAEPARVQAANARSRKRRTSVK